VKLPIVTPAQIAQARKIKVFFTGDLTREIKVYPAYPGTEKNYLRAQIARISATTHVSPAGKFKFSDVRISQSKNFERFREIWFQEEEEAEEEGGKTNYQENEEWNGTALSELIDEELNGWVSESSFSREKKTKEKVLLIKTHHVLHILPQGRTKWWNPNEDADKEEEETEEEEEIKESQQIQPEQGPQLLTPIGQDADIENTKAWTTKISSNLIPQYACAYVRSNLWPGAYAFARGQIWENIYVGYGHKYSMNDYKTEFPPLPASEYKDGPEITEAEDPTPEDEAKANATDEQGEEGEEEQEEMDNEDDED